MRGRYRLFAWSLDPGRWTMAHLTEDERVTLCGRRVPRIVFHYHRGSSAEDHRGVCRSCWKRYETLTKEGTMDWTKSPPNAPCGTDYTRFGDTPEEQWAVLMMEAEAEDELRDEGAGHLCADGLIEAVERVSNAIRRERIYVAAEVDEDDRIVTLTLSQPFNPDRADIVVPIRKMVAEARAVKDAAEGGFRFDASLN